MLENGPLKKIDLDSCIILGNLCNRPEFCRVWRPCKRDLKKNLDSNVEIVVNPM